MPSFYLHIQVSAMANYSINQKLKCITNLQSFLVVLYANLLYVSLIFGPYLWHITMSTFTYLASSNQVYTLCTILFISSFIFII
jgi:hypothetical protein